ncbi:hypothetical protein Ocin01_19522 [Orchesella cincta]|uniref:Uncharacterized protein n=1 Tax=Orchesella cincta TaxID=48709 RepID=A0A1D2M2L9_ORCCI|nr:hypothetical protein Ocin01_19522 [Orchesella cincta]
MPAHLAGRPDEIKGA